MLIRRNASTASCNEPAAANHTAHTATGRAPPRATRARARSRPPWARKSAPATTAVNDEKKAIWRHSVARLTNTPAVNQCFLATAHRAQVTKRVIGVFSRGPFDAYSMKPENVRKVAAETSPASLEVKTSRPSR